MYYSYDQLVSKIMKNKLVLKKWREFKDACLDGAPQLQVKEMRKAFYAGSLCTMEILTNIDVSVSDEEAANILSEVTLEAQEFFEKLTDSVVK